MLRRTNTSSLVKAHSHGSLSRLLLDNVTTRLVDPVTTQSVSWMFRLIQLGVFLFRLITPLSYFYTFYFLYQVWVGSRSWWGSSTSWLLILLDVWMLVEALFFLYYWYLFRHLHTANDDLKHFATCKASRRKLMEDCFAALRTSVINSSITAEESMQKVITDISYEYISFIHM